MSPHPIPEVGAIVQYQLTDDEATSISTGGGQVVGDNITGDQRSESATAGQVCTAIVVANHADAARPTVSLRLLLNGDLDPCVTKASEGEGPGHWSWLPRAAMQPTMLECTICGAWVGNLASHLRWHQDQGHVVSADE